jgi:hypothetical protein
MNLKEIFQSIAVLEKDPFTIWGLIQEEYGVDFFNKVILYYYCSEHKSGFGS